MKRFIETSAARDVLTAIEEALATAPNPSLVTSEPGMGKTSALEHYAEQCGAQYFCVNQSAKSPPALSRALFKLYQGYVRGQPTFEKVRDALVVTMEQVFGPRLLFIDEFQTLEAPALRDLLEICKESKTALVLSGNRERLATERNSDRGALKQIWNRVDYRVELTPPTPTDCRDLAITFDVEGRDAYEALATFGGQTSVRSLTMLLQRARRMIGSAGSIQLPHVEMAMRLEGKGHGNKLLQSTTRN